MMVEQYGSVCVEVLEDVMIEDATNFESSEEPMFAQEPMFEGLQRQQVYLVMPKGA